MSLNKMKIITKLTEDNYDGSNIDLIASNEELENDWWRIIVDGKNYDISGEYLKEFCTAILSIIK